MTYREPIKIKLWRPEKNDAHETFWQRSSTFCKEKKEKVCNVIVMAFTPHPGYHMLILNTDKQVVQ